MGNPSDSALNDRLYKIEVPGYSKKEKMEIVTKYSLKKIIKNSGLEERFCNFKREDRQITL